MIRTLHLPLMLALLIAASPVSVWAADAETPSAEDQEDVVDPEAKSEEGGKKRFWLTDPAMIEKAPLASAMIRTFPLLKEMAGDKALPRPLGLGLSAYWQKQDYDVTSAVIDIGGLPPFDLDVSGIDAKIDSRSVGVKADLWVLPFLNLYAGLGNSDTDADIFLRDVPTGVNPPDRPGGEPEIIRGQRFLFLGFEGPYWVVGGTIVGGYKRWFGSLSLSFARARLEASVAAFGTNDFDTERALPKLGYSFAGTSIWFGAVWMEETFHTGAEFDNGRIDVDIARSDWTPTIGMNTIMGEHWDLTVEGGFGDRVSALFHLGYRF